MKQYKPAPQLQKKSSNQLPKPANQPKEIASSEDESRSKRITEFIWLAVYFFVSIPPTLVNDVGLGLDPSWQLSVHLAVQKHFVFGQDYLFTMGPLGIFVLKYAIAISKWSFLIFELLRACCIIYIARIILKPGGYKIFPSVIFLLIIILLNSWVNESFLTPIFLFCIIYFLHHRDFLVLSIAALISVLSFYIKVNYGLILFALLYIAVILSLIQRTSDWRKLVMVITAQALLTFVLAFFLNVNLPGYIQSSVHLINAFGEAMYVPIAITNWYLIMGFVIIALYLAGFVLCYKYFLKDFIGLCCYLFTGLFLFLLLKNGYVRADAHIYSFFNSCSVVFGITCIFLKDRGRKIWGILTCCAVIVSYSVYFKKPEPFLNDYETIHHWGSDVFNKRYLKDLFTDVSSKNRVPISDNPFASVSDDFVKEIGQSTVDIIPWEISLIYSNHLNYNPRPVIQSYSAYDEYLDRKNYDKYVSNMAPEYIIYGNFTLDNRPPFWDESITKRAILTNYELIDHDSLFQNATLTDDQLNKINELFSKTSYILLKKRKQPLKLSVVSEKNIHLELDKEYMIDSTENIQYLYANPEYNFTGKLRGILFQPPGLNVIMKFQDSTTMQFEAVVPILKTGVLLNRQVLDTYQAGVFFNSEGKFNPRVISIRFVGGSGFKPEINAVIQEQKIVEQEGL